MERNSKDIKDANFLKIYWKLHGGAVAVAGLQKVSGDTIRLGGPLILQKIIDLLTLISTNGDIPVDKVSSILFVTHWAILCEACVQFRESMCGEEVFN